METLTILFLDPEIPEPKNTLSMDRDQISEWLKKTYHVDENTGRPKNVTSDYAFKITNHLFGGTKNCKRICKYPYVREEWIHAVIKHITGKYPEIDQEDYSISFVW